jgi:hypothetical protein
LLAIPKGIVVALPIVDSGDEFEAVVINGVSAEDDIIQIKSSAGAS